MSRSHSQKYLLETREAGGRFDYDNEGGSTLPQRGGWKTRCEGACPAKPILHGTAIARSGWRGEDVKRARGGCGRGLSVGLRWAIPIMRVGACSHRLWAKSYNNNGEGLLRRDRERGNERGRLATRGWLIMTVTGGSTSLWRVRGDFESGALTRRYPPGYPILSPENSRERPPALPSTKGAVEEWPKGGRDRRHGSGRRFVTSRGRMAESLRYDRCASPLSKRGDGTFESGLLAGAAYEKRQKVLGMGVDAADYICGHADVVWNDALEETIALPDNGDETLLRHERVGGRQDPAAQSGWGTASSMRPRGLRESSRRGSGWTQSRNFKLRAQTDARAHRNTAKLRVSFGLAGPASTPIAARRSHRRFG